MNKVQVFAFVEASKDDKNGKSINIDKRIDFLSKLRKMSWNRSGERKRTFLGGENRKKQ